MRKLTSTFLAAFLIFLVAAPSLYAQQMKKSIQEIGPAAIVNFTALAQQELINPPITAPRDAEADEDKHTGIPKKLKVPADATITQIELPTGTLRAQSPSPTLTFNGLLDNGQVIPPDVNGCVGLNHIMETLNSQYRIFSKTGSTVSTLSLSSFWSGISGSPFSDPHIEFDPVNNRWISIIISTLNNGHYGLFIGVSQTSDPTGNWFEYSIDTGSGSTIPDYPLLGFNTNWVVLTVNNFANGISFSNVKVFILNRASLYSGSSGTVTTYTDASGIFTVSGAKTYDNTTTTEYLLAKYNGNSSGNGFVKLFAITGSVGSPVYAAVNTIGINQTWSGSEKDAPQSGSTKLIATNDDRMRDVVYRNGSLWACHTVFLPASSPNRASVQWWQINPANLTVTQFGRVDDNTGATFFAFPSIAVNNNNDVLIGYSRFSASTFASAAYSYRTASDPVNTLEDGFTYKSGLASYYKTFGGSKNRWGDYSSACVDPTDGSLWTLQEFASSPSNNWGTFWANVPASNGVPTCSTPTGLTAGSITTSSATLSWGAVGSATNYNVQYKPTSSSTWISSSSSTNSLSVSGLTSGTQYEFQVQTVCSSSTSAFSASTNFTTQSTTTCTEGFEPNNSKTSAKPVSVNTNIVSQISSSTDKDWFSFDNTTAEKNVRVTLTTLPADYQLELYAPNGNKVAVSSSPGTTDEQINYNTTSVGTFKAKIYGFNGAFSTTQCYTFFATISSTPFRLTEEANGIANTLTSVFPNPNTGEMTVQYQSITPGSITLQVFDVAGKMMLKESHDAADGTNTYHLDLNQVTPGVYFLEIINGNEITHTKFIIER